MLPFKLKTSYFDINHSVLKENLLILRLFIWDLNVQLIRNQIDLFKIKLDRGRVKGLTDPLAIDFSEYNVKSSLTKNTKNKLKKVIGE